MLKVQPTAGVQVSVTIVRGGQMKQWVAGVGCAVGVGCTPPPGCAQMKVQPAPIVKFGAACCAAGAAAAAAASGAASGAGAASDAGAAAAAIEPGLICALARTHR